MREYVLLQMQSYNMKKPNEFDKYITEDVSAVIIDEVQFFAPADIDKLVQIADNQGKLVMCYGLMVDSNEKIFPASQRLLEVCDEIETIDYFCKCGKNI